MASYYRRYTDIAAPLTHLTQKGVTFTWDKECEEAFCCLKTKLTQAPVLAYPKLGPDANPFILHTDASAVGLGAVLEQDKRVIAYASRTLSRSEQHYSVIQKECLAIVFALKQFRHYLLGRKFQLLTDHAPLQWLSAQKMEGMLCRWALAMQEFDFDISYRKGSLNTNADALSRRAGSGVVDTVAVTSTKVSLDEIRAAQQEDEVLSKIYHSLFPARVQPSGKEWNSNPLHRYKQLWSQLLLVDGVVCRRYKPDALSVLITVPVLPKSLQEEALRHNHDDVSAGHLGVEKTLHRLQNEAYWVYMRSDVAKYCHECIRCQQVKPSAPTKAPLTNVPIGKPWQMVAVDVLEVPMSPNGNRYLHACYSGLLH